MKTWQFIRQILLIVLVFVVIEHVTQLVDTASPPDHVTFTQLDQMLSKDPKSVKDLIFVNGSDKVVLEREGKPPVAVAIPEKGGSELLVKKATDNNVPVEVKQHQPGWIDMLIGAMSWLLPLGLVLLFFMWMGRQQRGQMAQVSKAGVHVILPGQGKKTFKDVAGCDEAKEELQEVVDFLQNPGQLTALGGRAPRGVLLSGEPGNGKTLLAKAVAGEAGVPFISISGSGMVEMFVGVGAARVRDLFDTARAHKPCIIFIDELDAVGRRRGTGIGGGHDEREQTLNEILVQMDGMTSDPQIICIAATNRPDILDPALVRPGRFDRQVVVDYPDLKGRKEILQIHAQGKKFGPDFDIQHLAVVTPGYSGADLENTLNEAAAVAHRRHQKAVAQLLLANKSELEINETVPRVITMADAAEGAERVKNGVARTSRAQAMSEEEKRNTAKHELGHALIGTLLKGGDEVTKITVMPRGRSLGATYSLPPGDRFSFTKEQAIARIMMACGGRAAQKMLDGVIDTGASNDFAQANAIAHSMVTVWGMDEELGWLSIQDNAQEPFLGRSMASSSGIGPELSDKIDRSKNCIIRECMRQTEAFIEQYKDFLLKATETLTAKETILGPDWYQMLDDAGIQTHQVVASIACNTSVTKAPAVKPQAPTAGTNPEIPNAGGDKLNASPDTTSDGGGCCAPPVQPEA